MTQWIGETWLCVCGFTNAILRTRCRDCGASLSRMNDSDPADIHVCEACGATDGLYLSHHAGWLCNDVAACLERIAEPDYAALGYSETAVTELDLGNPYALAAGMGWLSGNWAGDVVDLFEKDIRGATDNG